MKFLKFSTIILLNCFVMGGLFAQEQMTESINEGSIKEQFDYTIKKSSNWKSPTNGQNFEVIKVELMQTLKAHAVDSLNAVYANLAVANGTIDTQEKEIGALKKNLAKIKDDLAQTNTEKESMAFLGVQMTKSNYRSLMWSIIGVITAALLFFIYSFKNSNTVTKATKNKLSELEEEFKEHRRVTLEREQKIKRELQNELNKNLA